MPNACVSCSGVKDSLQSCFVLGITCEEYLNTVQNEEATPKHVSLDLKSDEDIDDDDVDDEDNVT